ncbi:hypothetical protein [Pseudomonas chlororaphis]|uniref:hypothetical protein n=1 Tax=Pseudomonas chlororaphis TaxID=587753 RepID=UPI000F57DBFD|nr:hypothetical protein [Pseudomonas chlororaphis]WDG71194.1 hypothetical protein PUP65_24220 [Pseudomonas chlororaphis]WDH31022.1 hypothetical protein PUP81_10100 [Pseudomonas chlororaphis]WDH69720.1 hypothetical protein PUP78_24205 [Pseudomonas chlororaphis]
MAGKYAPKLFQVRYCRALEQGRGSQYSPRPPESGEKKSPDLKPDQKANLSRPLESTKAYRFKTEFTLDRLYWYSRAGVFALFFRLGSALAISNKADRSDDFSAIEKVPHQSTGF